MLRGGNKRWTPHPSKTILVLCKLHCACCETACRTSNPTPDILSLVLARCAADGQPEGVPRAQGAGFPRLGRQARGPPRGGHPAGPAPGAWRQPERLCRRLPAAGSRARAVNGWILCRARIVSSVATVTSCSNIRATVSGATVQCTRGCVSFGGSDKLYTDAGMLLASRPLYMPCALYVVLVQYC